jgi:hypothetical protein
MSKRRNKPSRERRAFERRTLARFRAAGASPRELQRCRWLLVSGRKRASEDLCAAMNRAEQERAGIEFCLGAFSGELTEVRFRMFRQTETSFAG